MTITVVLSKELLANLIVYGFPIIIYVAICWIIPIVHHWNSYKRSMKSPWWKCIKYVEALKLSAFIHGWTMAIILPFLIFIWAFYVKMGVL